MFTVLLSTVHEKKLTFAVLLSTVRESTRYFGIQSFIRICYAQNLYMDLNDDKMLKRWRSVFQITFISNFRW